MKFLKYNMKNILSVCCLGLILSMGTTGIWCPGWAGRDDEMLEYLEDEARKKGYVTVDEFSDAPQSSQSQVTNPQAPATETKEQTPKQVKTCSHNYEVEITKEATCSEDGVMTFTCSLCGDSYKEVIAKTGKHEYEETVTKEPTCTENGEKTFTCKNCSDSYTEEISATGHEYERSVTKEATCTEEGEIAYTCTKCGDTYTETVAATGHTEEEWQMTKKSGMFKKGLKEQVCASCGEVINTEVILSRCPIAYLYAGIGAVIALAIGAVVFRNNRSKALNEKGDLYDF